jgi:hypothetical protein
MKSCCAPRLPRRSRRPLSLPDSSVQARQQINQLRDLYELETVLELSRPNPNMNYLLQLDLESSNLHAIAAFIGVTL